MLTEEAWQSRGAGRAVLWLVGPLPTALAVLADRDGLSAGGHAVGVEDPVEVVDLMGDQAGGAAELARLAKALGGVEGYGPMVYLGAVDGLRWGEVAGLRVGRVDTEACTVAVVETIVRGRKGSVGGLVAAGVDVKTAQSVLAHTDARVTLDLYAQAVTEQQQAAADAMAARFDVGTTRPKRRRGPVTRPSLASRVGEI